MAFSDNLRRQHGEVLDLVEKITAAFKSNSLTVERVGELLPKLAGKLKVHLTMEDKALYPKLLTSDEIKVRQTAENFMNEMGNLKETFEAYLKHWNSVLKIKAQYDQFRLETETILTALTQRIAREDQELYEMADKEFDSGNFIK